MSSLRKDVLKKGHSAALDSVQEHDSPGAPVPAVSQRPSRPHLRAKYAPVHWDTCFDVHEDIAIPNTHDTYTFRVYRTEMRTGSPTSRTPVFLMHHGAGHSGLSFGLTAKHIKEMALGECTVVAYDCRGHGDTHTDDPTNLSLGRLTDDLVAVATAVLHDKDSDIILVGHSMGGAIVVDVAQHQRLPNIVGVVVLDVVEGSAMAALNMMPTILNARPAAFDSVEEAIQWCVRPDMLRNRESARVSVPSIVVQGDDNKWRWRTNLSASKSHWEGWFTGLSEKFLATPASKMLILAGTDRLDRPLMIGQMQGKLQLHIFPDAGHFLQEDDPERTARCLVDFWQRNRRLVLPPKVQV